MTRVQIPAYTDRWMRGDRYGEVVKTTRTKARYLTSNKAVAGPIVVAHVKLDVSGKTIKVVLDDCTVVS
jgi:hypothetical protein